MSNRFLSEARALLTEVVETQQESIEEAARACAEAIGSGSVVFLFGTGHSRIAVEEMFPRYGSFSGFVPMVELSMTYYTPVSGANGLRQAMFIERQSGLADVILANYALGPPHCLIVFSASGANAVPIELAIGARERGLKVIVVTSVRQSLALAPSHARGRLLDHGDVVVDIRTPPADALVALEGSAPVGPGSTLGYVLVVNAIKTRTAELLLEQGRLPPIIQHASVGGTEASAASIDAAISDHRARLARCE